VRALLERRFDVHLVHVLAPEEMNPELAGDLRLIDSRPARCASSRWTATRVRAYRERLRQHLERVETFCRPRRSGTTA